MEEMTLRERADNLASNYSELRGYTYDAGLIIDDILSGNREYDDDVAAAILAISSFLFQKVNDLRFDIKHLIASI